MYFSSSEFWHSSKLQSEKETKQKDWEILGCCQRTEKGVEHEADNDPNSLWRCGKETDWMED